MSNKYFNGRKERYIFCDICGQACYISDAVKLKAETGRGGLMVCPLDADKIDFGLIPYVPTTERAIEWSRVNHQNVTNGTAPLDIENTTGLGV